MTHKICLTVVLLIKGSKRENQHYLLANLFVNTSSVESYDIYAYIDLLYSQIYDLRTYEFDPVLKEKT